MEASGRYEAGVWSASFARSLRSTTSVSFAEGQYVPIAFSVYGTAPREQRQPPRHHAETDSTVYLPLALRSPRSWAPMLKAALGVLVLELVVVAALRPSACRRRPPGAAGLGREPVAQLHQEDVVGLRPRETDQFVPNDGW